MMRRASIRMGLSAALAGLLMSSGCATAKKPDDSNPFSQALADRNEVQIHVRNSHFSDATVWVMVRGARQGRLGYVTGKTDAVFTIPWTYPEPMRLEFDLLADVRCVTEEIMVDPGDILELQISLTPDRDPLCR